ncbi:MAG: hypothetical protein C7B46_19335 [Sulfobacillus benefaciens]|uniref:Uncharacterized protein n=1 Tax=Sulfobacillus benefaciens TaxID=453960 RepID=A0A2T2WZE5_9FIRM|nr:MAG: hypothetical protein C7B46_19335 [Sulfobacillus benefaciens]
MIRHRPTIPGVEQVTFWLSVPIVTEPPKMAMPKTVSTISMRAIQENTETNHDMKETIVFPFFL